MLTKIFFYIHSCIKAFLCDTLLHVFSEIPCFKALKFLLLSFLETKLTDSTTIGSSRVASPT